MVRFSLQRRNQRVQVRHQTLRSDPLTKGTHSRACMLVCSCVLVCSCALVCLYARVLLCACMLVCSCVDSQRWRKRNAVKNLHGGRITSVTNPIPRDYLNVCAETLFWLRWERYLGKEMDAQLEEVALAPAERRRRRVMVINGPPQPLPAHMQMQVQMLMQPFNHVE
jgi:hypothetical protein